MKGYRTKKIALPGGRTIEIVYFYDESSLDPGAGGEAAAGLIPAPAATEDPAHLAGLAAAAGVAGPPEDPAAGLHTCPECDSDLVYPVSWEERGAEGWHITRRCPNCEWTDEGDFDQEDVEAFDDILNEGTEALLTGLRNFSRANMVSDIERLIAAINGDSILPMDF